jgi:RNA polymerase sigma factor (sigma-70 family)
MDRHSSDIGHLLRELAPQVLGAVARRHDDFAMAEDAVQEALIAASRQWPRQGIPNNARGWLYQVAMRRLTDQLRSEIARRRREDAIAGEVSLAIAPALEWEADAHEDDSLILLFMCCHPALTAPTAIALTLRAVGGLTTAEIASAFMVPEATMAQRISRAKQTIKTSKIPFALPSNDERASRLNAVLQTLYLIFNEGYASSSGEELHRADLANEAIRLTRALYAQLPQDPEVAGLLALMLLTEARKRARTGASGELIPLDEQDRSLWDSAMIEEGTILISNTLSRGLPGPYQLQAAIAALHDEARNVEATDWSQILALYGALESIADNPMVKLNRAIASAMVHGPKAGLRMLDALDSDARMTGHYRMDAVRAHLFQMAGDTERAVQHFHAAAERTASIPERNYLLAKATRLRVRPSA